METDEAMTRRAPDLLGSKRNDAYEAALAALREDTQAGWADTLARDPDELREGAGSHHAGGWPNCSAATATKLTLRPVPSVGAGHHWP